MIVGAAVSYIQRVSSISRKYPVLHLYLNSREVSAGGSYICQQVPSISAGIPSLYRQPEPVPSLDIEVHINTAPIAPDSRRTNTTTPICVQKRGIDANMPSYSTLPPARTKF
ncbi:hypothetical protein VTL71DRAFT_8653 [Oculimacula yallundae]|uniref:Uncharacterized protein n=1 Tax=Oculimacula yallundae TaxID=86028 RepID=A0ABR4CYA1_9HELO